MKRTLPIIFFTLLSAFVLLAASRSSSGAASINGDALQGARIYDNWMLTLDLALPNGNQPLWATQETNIRNGVSTWRCVECHGWDYKGELGAYGPFSTHYTGFPGVQDMVGATEEEVLDWLNGTNNPEHNFLSVTNVTALQDLTAFLRTQQVDMDLLIDPYTGTAFGDRVEGRDLYQDTCARCHGSLGDAINFGSVVDPLYIADLAVYDPWQTVHKVRFGTATSRLMPSSEQLGWSLTEVGDLLAHAQTLRRGSPHLTFSNTESSGPVQVERQAQIGPIIWAAFVIFALVLGATGWDAYANRPKTAPKLGKPANKK